MSAFVVICGDAEAGTAEQIVRVEVERAPDDLRAWSIDGASFGHAAFFPANGDRSTQLLVREHLTVLADARIDDPDAKSDAGAVLAAYERWGDDCAAHLTGDFAFVIYDALRRRLVCARDFLGIRPLFHATIGSQFVVASTINMLRAHPQFREELMEASMVRYVAGNYADVPEETFYRGVFRLRPAHTLLWEDRRVSVRQYWTIDPARETRFRRPAEYVDHFLHLFDSATSDRIRGNAAAVMMSGGLDSTSVAATARHVRRDLPIHAYTTNFSSLFQDDEAQYAAMAASALHLEHHVFARDDGELFSHPSTYRRAEPFEDPLAEVFLSIAQDASRHSRVMLGGLGGDTLFRTSNAHFRDLLRHGRLLRAAADVASYAAEMRHLPPLALRSWVLEAFGKKPWQPSFPDWFRKDAVDRFGLRDDFERALQPAVHHPRRPEASRYVFDPFWSRYFETWDPGETRLPIECTSPILDRRVVEALFSYPPMPWFADKYLMRRAMKGRLPDAVRLRPKTVLAGDPLRFAVAKGRAGIPPLLASTPILREWIDEAKLVAAIERGGDLRALLPLTLARWWQGRGSGTGESG